MERFGHNPYNGSQYRHLNLYLYYISTGSREDDAHSAGLKKAEGTQLKSGRHGHEFHGVLSPSFNIWIRRYIKRTAAETLSRETRASQRLSDSFDLLKWNVRSRGEHLTERTSGGVKRRCLTWAFALVAELWVSWH